MREKQIERLVSYYTKIFHTTDPLAIAQRLNIIVQFGDLGEYSGCYMFLKNHRCIMISKQLEVLNASLSLLMNLATRFFTENRIVIFCVVTPT